MVIFLINLGSSPQVFREDCNTDYQCTTNDDVNPECGQKCWASSTSHFFRYQFKGEKFQVYGSKQPGNGNFSLLLDGEIIETINLKQDPPQLRTLVYTSDTLEYGDHTIGQQFEIYKFAFWPSVKAKRLNVTEFQSSGNWAPESDKIGGIRQYSNNKDTKKYITIDGSRFWIYGSKAFNHGDMTIKINDQIHTESQLSATRVDAALIYDTNDLPFKSYTISVENLKESNTILLYCLYYISDPPEQTMAPHPSRTLAPNTTNDYINKNFVNSIPPNGYISVENDQSKIKQVSGCTFTNINTGTNFIVKPMVEILFYDNTFEYTDPSITTIPVMWTKAPKLTFSGFTFKNFKDQTQTNEVTVFSVNLPFVFTIERCSFINCGNSDAKFMFKMNSYQSSLKVYDSTFSFDSLTENCKICNFKFTDILSDGCTFTRAGNEILLVLSNLLIILLNLTVKYLYQQLIYKQSLL